MSDEPLQPRDERTERVRELVWTMRSHVDRTQVRMGEVTSFLAQLEARRSVLRARSMPPEGRPVLDEALAELDSSHEEIRVVGEEMQRRGEQLLEWQADAAAKLRFHRRLIERAPMAFFLTDENGMIADANEEAARMLHVTSSYLRSKPIVNFVSRRDVGNARSFVRAVSRSEQVLENVIVFRPRRGGPTFTAEVRACALERNDARALGWLLREVPRAPADAFAGELQAAEPLAPSAGAPSVAALAAMSCELRAPLQAIESATSLLRRGLSGERGKSHLLDHCEAVARASQVMTRLTSDLLDAASVKAGTFSLERAPFDLRRLVEELLTAYRPRAARAGVDLAASLPREGAMVDGDFVRLTQVAATLLDNALEFSGDGRKVHVTLTVLEPLVRLEVRDQGAGISADRLAHVFERRRHAPGTVDVRSGVGLWLAHKIASAHEGALTVTSAPSEGSCFCLELPLRRR